MEFPGLTLSLSALKDENRPDPTTVYEVLILGGGPAAMSASVYAARKMLRLAVVTKSLGGQVALTSEIENYLGFQLTTGKDLVDRFVEQVRAFEVPIAQEEQVVEVRKLGEVFEVLTAGGTRFQGKTVVLATGKRDRPLGVPGERELVGRGVAYCATCDAPFYRGKKVVVAGGGNSAYTAALDLVRVDAEVTLVNLAAGWQADEMLIKAVKQKGGRVRYLDQHEVTRIAGTDQVNAVHVRDRRTKKQQVIAADGIFVEIGLLPNSEPVAKLVELSPAKEVVVDCRSRTSVEGLFGAGDVTTVPHKQIIISAGEGAKAALSAYEYLLRGAANV